MPASGTKKNLLALVTVQGLQSGIDPCSKQAQEMANWCKCHMHMLSYFLSEGYLTFTTSTFWHASREGDAR